MNFLDWAFKFLVFFLSNFLYLCVFALVFYKISSILSNILNILVDFHFCHYVCIYIYIMRALLFSALLVMPPYSFFKGALLFISLSILIEVLKLSSPCIISVFSRLLLLLFLPVNIAVLQLSGFPVHI